MSNSIICDTSILLYMGLIGQLDLLNQMYDDVFTTSAVCQELDAGRASRPNIINPHHFKWITVVNVDETLLNRLPSNRLGAGECSVIAYAAAHNLSIVGLDDRDARRLAERLQLKVSGSAGLLIRAKKAGILSSVKPLLSELKAAGLYLTPALITELLKQASEVDDSS